MEPPVMISQPPLSEQSFELLQKQRQELLQKYKHCINLDERDSIYSELAKNSIDKTKHSVDTGMTNEYRRYVRAVLQKDKEEFDEIHKKLEPIVRLTFHPNYDPKARDAILSEVRFGLKRRGFNPDRIWIAPHKFPEECMTISCLDQKMEVMKDIARALNKRGGKIVEVTHPWNNVEEKAQTEKMLAEQRHIALQLSSFLQEEVKNAWVLVIFGGVIYLRRHIGLSTQVFSKKDPEATSGTQLEPKRNEKQKTPTTTRLAPRPFRPFLPQPRPVPNALSSGLSTSTQFGPQHNRTFMAQPPLIPSTRHSRPLINQTPHIYHNYHRAAVPNLRPMVGLFQRMARRAV
ncbi:hypothetical protein HYFRA_00009731 [Hymenoscyphus fraxineus]|uniref:Uncharacterized protein n=1 Tax=Hymenoscyphus fraxineus TaxID=746836 RepID=A0A9N9PH53_9HELO|nr:hypothetical protein HYFRA_00009731 [Hymenoscyphus fraxineus]